MLSQEHIDRFRREGWLIVPGIVPESLCRDVIYTIINYLGLNLKDPESWYKRKQAGHGIVPLHHPQSLWNIRQLPVIHEIFSDLYGDERLWVSMDRVSYKPPGGHQSRDWEQAPIHWDCDPWRFKDYSIQGLVYLTDTSESQGAFCCVPSIFHRLDDWLEENRGNDLARYPKVDKSDIMSVEGPTGSLVLFNRLMPHSSLLNQSAEPRFVQYLAMDPEGSEQIRFERVKQWQEKLPPDWAVKQKIPDQQIPEPGPAAALTPLGRRLVGIDRW